MSVGMHVFMYTLSLHVALPWVSIHLKLKQPNSFFFFFQNSGSLHCLVWLLCTEHLTAYQH